MDGVTKVLKKLRFNFLIFDIESIEDKVEFPNFLYFKVFHKEFPIFVDLVYQVEVWLH